METDKSGTYITAIVVCPRYREWRSTCDDVTYKFLCMIVAALYSLAIVGVKDPVTTFDCICVVSIIVYFAENIKVPLFNKNLNLHLVNVSLPFMAYALFAFAIAENIKPSTTEYYKMPDFDATITSFSTFDVDLAKCESLCNEHSPCVMLAHNPVSELKTCRLFSHTLEHDRIFPIYAEGAQLAVKKIETQSKLQSDGKLYYLSEEVWVNEHCSNCDEHCKGYFKPAEFTNDFTVPNEIFRSNGRPLAFRVIKRTKVFQWSPTIVDGTVGDEQDEDTYETYYINREEGGKIISDRSAQILCQADPINRKLNEPDNAVGFISIMDPLVSLYDLSCSLFVTLSSKIPYARVVKD